MKAEQLVRLAQGDEDECLQLLLIPYPHRMFLFLFEVKQHGELIRREETNFDPTRARQFSGCVYCGLEK